MRPPAPPETGATSTSRWPLYGLMASLPFTDFLQIGLVAFSAAPIMGDLAASPEEYSQVATLYAVVAIAVIALQRWLLERLGWRRLVQASGLLLAAGAMGCGLSETLAGFAVGRAVMALGCASFMTTGRLLVNHIPPSPRRFTGIRFFASGLAWGVALGPMLASFALSTQGWRLGFFLLTLPALWMVALAPLALSDTLPQADPVPAGAGHTTVLALLALMGGSFLLLHGLQRSNYDFFGDAFWLITGLVLALPALAIFAWLNVSRSRSLIHFQPMAQSRYLTGLAIFGIAYLVLGANNTMLPVLLQKAYGLPLETVALCMGGGSLAGVATFIVLARLLPKHPAPTPYYVAGFGALLLCGLLLSRLSESASPLQNVMPALLCNGAFVIAVLATTAMQTFQTLQHDERVFSHANQIKNMLSQFGIAAGTALATLLMQWRSSLHYSQLSESLSPTNLALAPTLERLTQFFATTHDPVTAPRLALAQLALMTTQEATLMGALDYFVALSVFAGICLLLVLLHGLWVYSRRNTVAAS